MQSRYVHPPSVGEKEKRFFETLKNIFIGVPVEGYSGYINLMRIKGRYFERVMEPRLRQTINAELKSFPDFREELFDKLYTFFRRYFTESGSLGFFFTPYHQSVYEQVYTNEQDVVLFWKTARLYYIKTDRLFRSMKVEVDGFRFYFDVSQLEHKRANEKRKLIYTFKPLQRDDTEDTDNTEDTEDTEDTIVFTVHYSERGRTTQIDDIRRAIRDKLGLKHYTDAVPTEETLQKAFSVFERQSEVDYFLCKDARSFLREQFDLWLWQYLLGKPGEAPQTQWRQPRLAQLQALKRIAYQVIAYIAAFEDEVVKIWNKPKFVLNSHYVITLDRIAAQPGGMELLERLWADPNIEAQLQEWRELGMVDENFQKEHIWEQNLVDGKQLHPRYRYLPIDTKHFPNLELQIVALFDNLDEALDGWLIKSENYQALNTILPKFRGKVQTIYIDPPFNKEQDADYYYSVKYKDATWITLLENRLRLAKHILNEKGSIFVRCDYNGNMYVRLLMNEIFGEKNFRNEIIVRKTDYLAKREINNLEQETESLINYCKNSEKVFFDRIWISREPKWVLMQEKPNRGRTGSPIIIEGQTFYPREGYCWARGNEVANRMYIEGRLKIQNEKLYILLDKKAPGTNWTDIRGYSTEWKFSTENSEILLKRVIESTSNEGDLVMDFFLGSGTTVAVAHKLGRKWIGVEMDEHLYSVVLPRIKRVLFYDKSGISEEKDVKARYNEQKAGGFFKYYELEQFEETLRRTRYVEDDSFTPPANEDPCQYLFLRDLKMLEALEALEVDWEQGRVRLNLSKSLYEGIDLPETLSNLTGKWIRRIYPSENKQGMPSKVEFVDGESVELDALDWRRIKPLIWW